MMIISSEGVESALNGLDLFLSTIDQDSVTLKANINVTLWILFDPNSR